MLFTKVDHGDIITHEINKDKEGKVNEKFS